MALQIKTFLVFFLVTVSSLSVAQSSRSSLSNNELTIPRIDVEGFGALELHFALGFESDYLLTLKQANETIQNIANSGTFDAASSTLLIDEVMLESGELFAFELNIVPTANQIVFQITSATSLNSDATLEEALNPIPEAAQALYVEQCSTCHGDDGAGTSIGPSLTACANCGSSTGLANYIQATMPLGGAGSCDANCSAQMAAYIQGVFNRTNDEVVAQTVGLIEVLDANTTLRRVSEQLLSRIPQFEEISEVFDSGNAGLELTINNMMEQPEFYDRLTEIFNDYLLTDKYHSRNGSEAAINLLGSSDFPNRRWFDPGSGDRPDDYNELRANTNNSIAREPLELINYVVKNNLPFTQIVTADYMMMSPFSAQSYGVEGLVFKNPNDPDEFVPALIEGWPHAGILTSPMFLNRYPTTSTNRNRARSRVVFDLFLDTDVLAIEGVRPGNAVDISTPIPTINNPECSKCHTILDPVASLFQNWDYKGRYRPARLSRNGWYTDMEVRGFAGQAMPLQGNVDSSLQWLGAKIAADPKFPRAVTRILFAGLTGKEPLTSPDQNTATQTEIDAYVAERSLLNEMQDHFVADNYNLKTLAREILMSPLWRATGIAEGATSEAHLNTGSSYLLTPEQLDRKITSLFGFEWRGSLDSYYKDKDRSYTSKLNNTYHQIYGGIDSDSVTTRLKSPNGLMGSMQIRMANELACYSVSREFWKPQKQRRLFLFVDHDSTPYDELGRIDESVMARIRQNIQYLHTYLLREPLLMDSEEFKATEQLFMNTLNRGRQLILNSGGDRSDVNLPDFCDVTRDFQGNDLRDVNGEDLRLVQDRQYVIRAWMAVIAYLISDYKFLYS
ncbi:MAG: c-type cytochrome [Pseudohongiellaceae bacterium]